MKTADFDYHLPQELIAQTPVEPRHASRLFVIDRTRDLFEHSTFWNITEYLRKGDLLVFNETKVIPARIFGRKEPGGGRVELLLIKKIDNYRWESLVGGKGLRAGKQILLDEGGLVWIEEELEGSRRIISFSEPIENYLHRKGKIPLPPYIHTALANPDRYQTIYAKYDGSAAAPTAGLHFTDALFEKIDQLGIHKAFITLHVGLDTFAPVHEEHAEDHTIHSEWCEVSLDTVKIINETRKNGGRIIAVGTTTVRTLESAMTKKAETITPFSGSTRLFILPGYQFRIVDAMITNFHLPKSTLIMLVSAFAGRERILRAYQEAVKMGYRFYSFGDAMFIH